MKMKSPSIVDRDLKASIFELTKHHLGLLCLLLLLLQGS